MHLLGKGETNRTNPLLMLGFVLGGNHLLRVGKKGTEDKTEQPKICEDSLPVSGELPHKSRANDGWNAEDDGNPCFSFRLHFVTPPTLPRL